MSKRINSYQAVASFVRGFFEAYARGIMDAAVGGDDFQKKNDPKVQKEKQEVDQKGGPETRNAILQLITSNGNITSREIASTLNINRSAISKHLKKMQEDHIIRREGSQKSGKWVIIS